MLWFKSIPIVSIALVLITYAIFGWSIAEDSVLWSEMLEKGIDNLLWDVEKESMLFVIHALALLVITLTSLALTAPITLMTYFVGTWLESEWESILSMVAWSFVFVVALRWFHYFATFLVLVCAATLGRLELRYAGLNQNQTLIFSTSICLLGFSGGVLGYFHYHPHHF